MKKVYTLLFLVVLTLHGYCQPPQGFQYQAILKDIEGNLLTGREVSLRIGILQSQTGNMLVYSEKHNLKTGEQGQVSLVIGKGSPLSGKFESIRWDEGDYMLKVEVDPAGGSNYTEMGMVQLWSVPYAMYSGEVKNAADADADPENELQSLSKEGLLIHLSRGGGSVKDSVVVYTAGQGIRITGQVISLDVPDPYQPVPIHYRGRILWVFPTDHFEPVGYGLEVLTNAVSAVDGLLNTRLITETPVNSGLYAAEICKNLVAFGFSDWYLPSIWELDAIYKQSHLIMGLRFTYGYWSSTEASKNQAWYQNLNYGYKGVDNKNHLYWCRCVRRD